MRERLWRAISLVTCPTLRLIGQRAFPTIMPNERRNSLLAGDNTLFRRNISLLVPAGNYPEEAAVQRFLAVGSVSEPQRSLISL
jgi:hypothetical protein